METGTLTREAVRELDRRAIEEYGIPSVVLMENAGRACAVSAIEMLGAVPDEPVLVLAGPGNNGGDGFVVARTLVNRGYPADVVFVGDQARLDAASGDARLNAELWRRLRRAIELLPDAAALDGLAPRLARAPLVVDALVGTGLSSALRSPMLELVRALNASRRPVLAVDLPSGLDADTGAVLGEAVRATTTVTFVARKPGFAVAHGPRVTGRLLVAEIGIPHWLVSEALRAQHA